jgi:nitrogen fixation NifU-like protein
MGLDIYAEELIYNYENPSNKRKIEDATISISEENVSCGDSITVYLKIEGEKILDVAFDGSGCVISMGTANILTNYIKGKRIKDVERMTKEDLLNLISIDPGPVRLHCATLSLKAIKKAIFTYERKPLDTATKEL